MPNLPEKPDDSSWLEKYLDSAPDSPERAEADRAMSSNRQMQLELQLQRQIEESLKRLFVPSAAPADLLARLQAPTPLAQPATKPRRNWAKIAVAAIAVSLIWGFLIWQFLPSRRPVIEYKNLPLATIYDQTVASGFQPYWVCKDPHEFASTFFTRQGQGLLLADMPAGTKMEGLAYTGGISPSTTTMLARTDGQPIMIFVDRASADIHPELPKTETKLHLFRKELGPLVLYELTPLNHPTVMDYLHLGDVPPETAPPETVPTLPMNNEDGVK
jgi:hypothetical protein